MPEGLEKRFTQEEFVDLIAFLPKRSQGAVRDSPVHTSVRRPSQ
jgi:hypothetical protein